MKGLQPGSYFNGDSLEIPCSCCRHSRRLSAIRADVPAMSARCPLARRVGVLFDGGQPLRRATCAILLQGPLFIVPASLHHRWDAFDDDWVQRLERRRAWEEPVRAALLLKIGDLVVGQLDVVLALPRQQRMPV